MRWYICILISCLFFSFGVSRADSRILPTVGIPADYIIAGNLNHELGQRWLKARGLKGQGEFSQARNQYILLLDIYPDLIQARFEYVQVLQVLGLFKDVEMELELLLELEPENLQYKQALGTLLLGNDQEKQGLVLLEEVWQERQDIVVAQLLYRLYTKSGQKQKKLVVLEYLYKQSINDVHLHDELFVHYIELGDDRKAQNFAPVLAENSSTSLKQLILAAELHGRLGLEHLAADYWQAVLEKQPGMLLAHEKLVQYYSENSRADAALPHKIFLHSHDGDNRKIAGEIGDYYVGISECSQAVFFLKQSLRDEPHQVERLKGLAYCYESLGEIVEAAAIFDAYFKLQKAPTSEDRLTGAKVFVAADREEAAAHQYRELLVTSPGDVTLLVALAEVETALGNYHKALLIWKQVAHRKKNDVFCRLQILSLSEKLGIQDTHSVLSEIHTLDQTNHRVALLLALTAFQQGQYSQGMQLFQPLIDSELFSADLLALRGEIFLLLNMPEHGFDDFSEAIKDTLGTSEAVVLGLVQVAGVLGRLDVVHSLGHDYELAALSKTQTLLLYADALAGSGDFTSSVSIYKQILTSNKQSSTFYEQARIGLSRLYSRYGFEFEAEQENRLSWLETRNASSLFRLIRSALNRKDNEAAMFWRGQYIPATDGFDPDLCLVDIDMFLASGDTDNALLLVEDFEQFCPSSDLECAATRLLVQLDVVQVLFQDDETVRAHELVVWLGQRYPDSMRPLVVALKMAVQSDDTEKIKELYSSLLMKASGDAGDFFNLYTLLVEYDLPQFVKKISQKMYKANPKSLTYGLNFVKTLIENSSFDEALNVIIQLQDMYPEALLLNLYGGQVCLGMGEFEKGLSFVESIVSPKLYKSELLRARLLWGGVQWDEALNVYKQNLTPDAEVEFRAECDVLSSSMYSFSDSSLWSRVVAPRASRLSPLEKSFSSHLGSFSVSTEVALVATTFFAQKKWQSLMSLEFDARKSVREGEYFHAAKQYEAMGTQLSEPTLLFDLAGVYAGLSRVGEEAVIYDKISQINPDYPGLSQAMNRNQLRRRPQAGMTLKYFEEDGRDGYKDIQLWRQRVHGWYSPRPRQEGVLSGSYLSYKGSTGDSVHGYEFVLGASSKIFDSFLFEMQGGIHSLNGDYPDTGIFNVNITGMAGDFLKSTIGVERRVVQDTVASLSRGIVVDEYSAELSMDLLPRLQIGGELSFAHYSDSNDMRRYSFWGVFVLRTQPDYLYFKVGYEFINHQNSASGAGVLLDDGFGENDHPYWAPVNYWRNQYTLGYKHTYSDKILGHQIPGFVSVQYSVDHDVVGDLLQHFATGVHMEIGESWLFSFNGSVDFSDEYDASTLDCTVEYRW